MANVLDLRGRLQAGGLEVYGDPSAIVAVKMGSEALARLVSRRLPEMGLIANLVEYPAVPKAQARFRMQVMAGHDQRSTALAVARLMAARAVAIEEMEEFDTPAQLAAA
jgi:glycine C-acetyltransferase